MKNYPYFLVERRTGRLANNVPIQFRHTIIERQFKNGRIGGTNVNHTKLFTAQAVQEQERRDRLAGAETDVYVILRPNSCKLRVQNVHGRLWTIVDKRVPMDEVDEWAKARSA